MAHEAKCSASITARASGTPEIVVGVRLQEATSQPTANRRDRWSRPTLFLLAALVLLPARAAHATDAKKIFNQRCTACHTFGKGVKVGPDLKGVTARRQRPWLLKFIRSSQTVIGGGDPVATALFRTFKKQRMPDWTDLSPQDVNAILDWLAADGPEQKPADERDAELATTADIGRARALFDGRTPLASGGLACAACHSVRDHGHRVGGTLGPELTDTYVKYRDRALTLQLRHPCTPRQPELSTGRYLEPDEAFAIKAYLRDVALAASRFATYSIAEAKPGRGTP
jgi:mono/diheme cytochrome c family protein